MSEGLRNLLVTHPHRQIIREYSGVLVYYLPELHAYLKIGELAKNSGLTWERDVLGWLGGKISVPEVLGFELVDGCELILISEIGGENYADQVAASVDESEIENLAEKVGSFIRTLHDLPIHDCHLDQRLDTKLKKAEQNINGGFVDESDFEIEDLGKTASQIYEELLSTLPSEEDHVFTHGDLCLPNIMISESNVSGLIDFDRGGVSDPYQDIALFLRSFRLNSATPIDIERAFCRGYGIEVLCRNKIDFYRKLDELF